MFTHLYLYVYMCMYVVEYVPAMRAYGGQGTVYASPFSQASPTRDAKTKLLVHLHPAVQIPSLFVNHPPLNILALTSFFRIHSSESKKTPSERLSWVAFLCFVTCWISGRP